MSLNPKELKDYVSKIRQTNEILGGKKKRKNYFKRRIDNEKNCKKRNNFNKRY